MVQSQISKCLSVQSQILCIRFSDELRVRHSVITNSCIDTLYPDAAVYDLLVFTSAVCVGKTFFIYVLRNGPNVFSLSPVSAGSL